MARKTIELVGREREKVELDRALEAVRQGQGGIILLTGEAGVGKTRLAGECLERSELLTLNGATSEVFTPPYGPVCAALRSYLRVRPGGLSGCGPLAHYLSLLLPEFGPLPASSDSATLNEAICSAFAVIARSAPVVFFLEDLQWADHATLEFLPALARALAGERLLILATYRSDEIPRGHPVRRLRNELRRAGLLHEILIEPLEQEAATVLAAGIIGQTPGPVLAAALYERTEGLPLFVEELASALAASGWLRQGETGLELDPGAHIPIPDTLRDAVLLQLDGLPEPARRWLEIAAVAGSSFDIRLVERLAGGETGFSRLVERGLLVEGETGRAAFRHALMREAIYRDISWLHRRTLHRRVAEQLEEEEAHPSTVAEHWLAAQEQERARSALAAATRMFYQLYAYQDAVAAANRALNLWPDGVDEEGRLGLLDLLGHCAQLCGMYTDAARAWRDVAVGWQSRGDTRLRAEVERKLANVYELQGHWEQALVARTAAAQGFAAHGLFAEAAAERLAAAGHLRSAGRYRTALELLVQAAGEVGQTERWDLKARILGQKGNVLARMGQVEEGLTLVREGLALALEHNLAVPAAEIYQRLADSLEHAGDYQGAKDTYMTAFDFCQANAVPSTAQLCIACLTVVLRSIGEWERAMTLCRTVLASKDSSLHARAVASGMLGILLSQSGQLSRARPLLLDSAALAHRIELAAMEMLSAWGLAVVDQLNGDYQAAAEHCRFILNRWQEVEDRHYVTQALRWVVTFFAQLNSPPDARACANALARVVTDTGQAEALSALAHALGEIALLEGNPAQAVQQFTQALELLKGIDIPYCYALTQFRAGVACAAAADKPAAIEHLSNAYRTARKFNAPPLANMIANALDSLGEPVGQHLGERADTRYQHHQLTRRQLEILRLVALGQTTPEIARQLVLSPRTVEMHVSNILAAFDSRSRTEAVRKATELGLLTS